MNLSPKAISTLTKQLQQIENCIFHQNLLQQYGDLTKPKTS